MSRPAVSVLYVRLPVWKIYPGGVIYVADFVHKQRPDVRQELLDMALLTPKQRVPALIEAIERLRPDVVAFSWRNMQTFGPHPENDALDVVMNFDHSPNPLRRLQAGFDALGIIKDYALSRWQNFSFMRLVRKRLPEARIVVGGTAVSIFGKYIAEQCPNDTVVVVGEGEQAMLSVVDGFTQPAGHHYYKDTEGVIHHRPAEENFDLAQLTAVDFSYVEGFFPGFKEYLGDYVGVHTKRGCPFQCHFCLYNKIEGARQRFRDPTEVAREVEVLNQRYGVRHVWFTDAQFCSTLRSTHHVEAILDEMIGRRLDVRWTGYLRLNYLTQAIARKMLDSGLTSIDLSFTGTQDIIDSLTLGYDLDQQMAAFRLFKDAGHTDQQVKLYMPLNAPGETKETLLATIDRIKELYKLFGRDNVLPFIFFIGIQPNTPVERRLIQEGYLKANYNPLSLNPFLIKKLLYNPAPLGGIIARAYLEAMASHDPGSDYIGRTTMENLERHLRGRIPTSVLGPGSNGTSVPA
ncbi:MAG: B12-binding domain-containing radical SAM protein [Pseudomonadota bacterium]